MVTYRRLNSPDVIIVLITLIVIIVVQLIYHNNFGLQPAFSERNVPKIGAGDGTPTFLLHIGPKKTGSTTIQCSFQKSRNLLASTTPYRYVGKQSRYSCDKEVPEDLFGADITDTLSGTKRLINTVLLHLRRGNSPIFSSERVGTRVTDISALKRLGFMDHGEKSPLALLINSVRQEDWHIKPVLTYRRFYEWVPSYYNQKIGTTRLLAQNETYSDCKISMRAWFDLVPNCPGFGEIFTDLHPVQTIVDGLKHGFGFDDIDIVNMHQMTPEDSGDVFSAFVRQEIPGSGEFLKKFKEEYISHEMNTSGDKITNFYQLAFAVYVTEGLESKKASARAAAKALEKNYDEIITIFGGENNIPIVCLSDEQQARLLELSLRFEKELFPEWLAMDGVEIEHKNGFQDYVDRGKFCGWDVKKMLQKEELRKLAKNVVVPTFS